MADWSGSPVSKNFEDRTWQTILHRQLNNLFDFLNRPRDTKKSYSDPYEQVYAHARPNLPADPDLLRSFFSPDFEPDAGAVKKSPAKNQMYQLMLLEQQLRKMERDAKRDKSSPMTQGQVLGGGYDE